MGQKYLIDTCAVVKYLGNIFPRDALAFMDELINDESLISFITKIELLVWDPPVPEDINVRKQFINGSKVLYIDENIIEKAIQIRKEKKIKIPDAIIAATAISNNLILISDNDSDFKKVKSLGLQYLNPKLISY